MFGFWRSNGQITCLCQTACLKGLNLQAVLEVAFSHLHGQEEIALFKIGSHPSHKQMI